MLLLTDRNFVRAVYQSIKNYPNLYYTARILAIGVGKLIDRGLSAGEWRALREKYV